jgi:amidase
LKDIIQTSDMPTTGGALAFQKFVPPYEATLTRHLRSAGAVIIAKTGLTELANWIAGEPTPMPTHYNAIQGFGFNPYDPRVNPGAGGADGRPILEPGGSSSGIGTAANLWAASVGTETSGSILNPSSQTFLAAVKPTVGRVSRHGVIPITADQDTPGPMAKWLVDAAIMLGVLEGAAPDPNDPATDRCPRPPKQDYTAFLRRDGLKGARIGIPRAYFYSPVDFPGFGPSGGLTAEQWTLMAEAIALLEREGATVVDPADIPSFIDRDPANNYALWGICSGSHSGRGNDGNCSVVLKYGMKRDFNRWLASLGTSAPVKSLTELRAWNAEHRDIGALKYGQTNLDISDEMDVERDRVRYEADRAKDLHLSAAHGIDEVLASEKLDALMFPGAFGASLAARPGYPSVIVPLGFVPSSMPRRLSGGVEPRPEPLGVTFTGTACSEPRLLEIAYAFEQATRRRVPPSAAP